MSKQSKDTPED